jgi:hypothetical protein
MYYARRSSLQRTNKTVAEPVIWPKSATTRARGRSSLASELKSALPAGLGFVEGVRSPLLTIVAPVPEGGPNGYARR